MQHLLRDHGRISGTLTCVNVQDTCYARFVLPASVMGALRDPGSTLHASCAGLGTAASDLLARAQRSGHMRADLKTDELLATVYAMAWAARQAPVTAGAGDRLLELLVEGLAARPVQSTGDRPDHVSP